MSSPLPPLTSLPPVNNNTILPQSSFSPKGQLEPLPPIRPRKEDRYHNAPWRVRRRARKQEQFGPKDERTRLFDYFKRSSSESDVTEESDASA